jgi:predicted SprT family Zn-dependent metalloprotease
MENHDHDYSCQLCDQPMRLIRRLPQIGGAPELLVFYCRDCNEIGGRAEWRSTVRDAVTTLN